MLHLALCLQTPDKTGLGLGWFQKTKDRLDRQLEIFYQSEFCSYATFSKCILWKV